MEENFESTNINIRWLENIYDQLKGLQEMERLSREGCNSLTEYLQLPFELQGIIIPNARYKNLRFMILEVDMLINNLAPILKENTEKFKKRLAPILKSINERELFLKDKKVNNKLVGVEVLPFLDSTTYYLILIKSDIIKDIGHILYLPEDKNKTW